MMTRPIPRLALIQWGNYDRPAEETWSRSGLRDLAEQNTPTRVIGIKTGRTEAAVQSKVSDEGISLKPTNQRPYNPKP